RLDDPRQRGPGTRFRVDLGRRPPRGARAQDVISVAPGRIVDKVNQFADRDFIRHRDGLMRPIDQRADVVRLFNRFYTHRIGALGSAHLGSEFSLTEVRVLYELAHGDRTTASGIASALGIDRGYLSRTLRAFKRRGLIDTRRDADDRRHTHLALTQAGRK